MLLFRTVKAKGHFLGRIKVHSIIDDQIIGNDSPNTSTIKLCRGANNNNGIDRDVFLPLDHNDGSNPDIELETPFPGIFIYRFSEGFNYPNANNYLDHLTEIVLKTTRLTGPNEYPRPGVSCFNLFFAIKD